MFIAFHQLSFRVKMLAMILFASLITAVVGGIGIYGACLMKNDLLALSQHVTHGAELTRQFGSLKEIQSELYWNAVFIVDANTLEPLKVAHDKLLDFDVNCRKIIENIAIRARNIGAQIDIKEVIKNQNEFETG